MKYYPYTSHRFQPLDRSVYSPFKGFYNQAENKCMFFLNKCWEASHNIKFVELPDTAYFKFVVRNSVMKVFTVTRFIHFAIGVFIAVIVANRPMLNETDFVEQSTSGLSQTDNIIF